MSQLNVNIIKNEAGTAGPTLFGDVTITGSINTSGIITSTSIVVSAGTTALPSISPTGDSNTGIFFPSADTIAFSEGGAEALRVDSSGRLLVGTSSAVGANLLQVNSDALVNGITVGRGLASVSSNTVLGNGALSANTGGSSNVAIGYLALRDNTTGSQNVAIGQNAMRNNTIGSDNTVTGFESFIFNTTGNFNVANGISALRNNTTGTYNVAVGQNALLFNTTGTGNLATGTAALLSNTTGSNNTAVGVNAGYGNTTGSNNTFIGHGADKADSTTNNIFTLGNSSVATLRCQVTTITALSDARDKTNITNIPAGLDFINALRPVAFDWNMRDGGKVGIHEFGFIAQELQEVQASTGITVPNLVSAENPDKLEASAGTLLPVLVNAVQELTAMVRDLQTELSILKGA